jgi:hypothetical protein
LASAKARWSDCSRLRENVGISISHRLYWTLSPRITSSP